MRKSLLVFIILTTYAVSFVNSIPGIYKESSYSLFIPKKSMHKMIVVLHGSGERGLGYLKAWQAEAETGGYVILAPNSKNKDGWSSRDIRNVLDLVKTMKRNYEIRSILLNGSSAGGHFALFLAINNYKLFNAVATFMGLISSNMEKDINFMSDPQKQIPILLIHGALDKKIPVKYARWNYRNIQAKAYPVTYWEEPEMGHEHYISVNKDILNWFESNL